MTKHHLNATRLLCPLPVIRVQDRVRDLAPGEQLEVVCTDPGVLQDIPAWCRINGHRVLETRRDPAEGTIILLVEVGGGA